MTARARAYVGLGSNVGDSAAALRAAVHALAALPGTRLRSVSPLYRTRPVGVVEQPDFLNAAVALDVPSRPDPPAAARALLLALKSIERAFGRRERERWGPRELDLDLLVFGAHRIRVPRPPAPGTVEPEVRKGSRAAVEEWLVVPHEQARDRLFVLAPLAALAPRLVPPGWGETVQTAARRRLLVEGAEAVERVAEWDPAEADWRPAQPP